MSKKLSIVIIVIIAMAAVWFYKNKSEKEAFMPIPAVNPSEAVDEMESINIGDIDQEFNEIDQELNGL